MQFVHTCRLCGELKNTNTIWDINGNPMTLCVSLNTRKLVSVSTPQNCSDAQSLSLSAMVVQNVPKLNKVYFTETLFESLRDLINIQNVDIYHFEYTLYHHQCPSPFLIE